MLGELPLPAGGAGLCGHAGQPEGSRGAVLLLGPAAVPGPNLCHLSLASRAEWGPSWRASALLRTRMEQHLQENTPHSLALFHI